MVILAPEPIFEIRRNSKICQVSIIYVHASKTGLLFAPRPPHLSFLTERHSFWASFHSFLQIRHELTHKSGISRPCLFPWPCSGFNFLLFPRGLNCIGFSLFFPLRYPENPLICGHAPIVLTKTLLSDSCHFLSTHYKYIV